MDLGVTHAVKSAQEWITRWRYQTLALLVFLFCFLVLFCFVF